MKKRFIASAALLTVSLIAGCGSSGMPSAMMGTSTTSVSGKVADGYLVGATVFIDKNGNYQLDAGEPSTTTGEQGTYTLNANPNDVGTYPIVAMAIAGQTIDLDNPGQTIQNSYMLSMPATAVSGTVSSNFISPMSTLIREKLAANPGMTLTEAMTQLRNQMNLPAGINMMADYVAGSLPGTNAVHYQAMHANARKMADLMAGQAGLVMSGTSVNMSRYRTMMGTINSNMSAITANTLNSTFMTGMQSQMQNQLGTVPMGGGFANYSGMFRNMTSRNSFWSNTGAPMTPMSGGMMH